MEERNELLLQVPAEIDQQIATGDQIEPGERRIGDDVVRRERHHFPQFLRDLEAAAALDEKAGEPLGREIGRDAERIKPATRNRQGAPIYVGGEDLDLGRIFASVQHLANENRDGIGLLSGGAGRDPDAHRVGRRAVLEERRQGIVGERGESFGVAEESRDADQQFAGEHMGFPRFAREALDIGIRRVRGAAHACAARCAATASTCGNA